ncbi:peptidylprolyl isomerase [Sandaracinomonas limnophila]|uniref:Peptidyl-prolyl cis-trans isomerase n=1 Tax=Sandaracinomonas limnophila TaxID=1862386 RepID=A0A437PR61_9BACT|nr:peptidylprolyl isomerase [Sandaracinomonas limnophila]
MYKLSCLFLGLFLVSCQENWNIDPLRVKEFLIKESKNYPERMVEFETRLGNFQIELSNKTPLTTTNFIRLVKLGYFKDRYFYRNIYDSGMQGGGEYKDRLDYLVPAEYVDELRPVRGTIAMARYDEGNPEKASSSTEFFIVTDTEEAKRYYNNYVVFGKVISGISVLDSMKKQRSFFEKPVVPVKFSIKVVR